VAGAILAGEKTFLEKSKVWKRRHGGDLISLYPYILSADYYFNPRVAKMEQYFVEAKQLAELFNQCYGVSTIPLQPVSNMFHVHFKVAREKLEPVLAGIYEATGIGVTGNLRETEEGNCFFELSLGDRFEKIPKERLMHLFDLLDGRLKQLKNK
jgi:threonine aldolase